MITLYGIKNCDTVKKTRRWLEANNCDYHYHDFRSDGLDPGTLDAWLQAHDWNTLLNRRSTTWKQLSEAERKAVDESNVRDLLLSNPTLIKRPVTVSGRTVLIGFSEASFQDAFL